MSVALWPPVPWQKFLEAVLRGVGDAHEDVGEPGLRVDVVEFSGADEAVDDGGPLGAAVRSGEEPGFAAEASPLRLRSAALFVRQIRPSPRKRAKPSHRRSM